MKGKRRTDCSRPSPLLDSWGGKTDGMAIRRTDRLQQLRTAFQNQLAYAEGLIKDGGSTEHLWNAFKALYESHSSLIKIELPRNIPAVTTSDRRSPQLREDKVKELFTLVGN